MDDGIRMERERLRTLKEYADYILDTSKLLTRELKAELEKIFVENREFKKDVYKRQVQRFCTTKEQDIPSPCIPKMKIW